MGQLTEDLKKLMMEIGQNIYSQTENSGPGQSSDDGVIETDFSTEK